MAYIQKSLEILTALGTNIAGRLSQHEYGITKSSVLLSTSLPSSLLSSFLLFLPRIADGKETSQAIQRLESDLKIVLAQGAGRNFKESRFTESFSALTVRRKRLAAMACKWKNSCISFFLLVAPSLSFVVFLSSLTLSLLSPLPLYLLLPLCSTSVLWNSYNIFRSSSWIFFPCFA